MATNFQIRGLLDPTKKFFYAEISKNASQKIKGVLYKEGWVDPPHVEYNDRYSFIEDKRIFCVLRNPYERYLTGFVNYIISEDNTTRYDATIGLCLRKLLQHDNKLNFEILKLAFGSGRFDFDVHTELQTSSLNLYDIDNIDSTLNLYDINNIDYFYLNDTLGHQLTKYFQDHNNFIPFTDTKVNTRSDEDFYKSLLRDFFEHEEHMIFKEKLLNYLKPDYELIKLVTFYDV